VTAVMRDLGFEQPTTAATPLIRPLMMLSLSGVYEAAEGPAEHVVDGLVAGSGDEVIFCAGISTSLRLGKFMRPF